MKKKLFEVMNVISSFELLAKESYINFATSYKIAFALKKLNEQKEFYLSEERKLVNNYASKDENGRIKIVDNNRITFDTIDDGVKFNEEIAALKLLDVDVNDEIEIKLSDFKNGGCNLTPNDILALEGFVTFIDKEA